jgi:hypothetical protein
MPVSFCQGDIFLTQAQTVAVGVDALGRLGVSPLFAALGDRYPVFVSDCRRRGRSGGLVPGSIWVWREATPWLAGMVVRESPHSATRLRYVEAALLNLCKNWQREGLHSLALMQFVESDEWHAMQELVVRHLESLAMPVVVYERYRPGVVAAETGAYDPASSDDGA